MKIKRTELRRIIREEAESSKKNLNEGALEKIILKLFSKKLEKTVKKAGIDQGTIQQIQRDFADSLSNYEKIRAHDYSKGKLKL